VLLNSKIAIPDEELENLTLENVCYRNGVKDDLQNDMLLMMLKRLLILCTYTKSKELTTFEKTIGL
jgi:hypothetical protein